MKAKILIGSVLLVSLIFSLQVFAQENDPAVAKAPIDSLNMHYERTPLNKLGRGLINTLTCWVEIPAEACKLGQEKDPLTGSTLGIAEGFVTAIVRGATGIFDVVTFIIPPYNRPVMKPEYALQSAFEKCKEKKKPVVIIKNDTENK